MTKIAEARGSEEMPVVVLEDSESQLDPKRTALVVIDMVNWNVHPDGALIEIQRREGVAMDYQAERLEQVVVPNLQRLIAHCRAAGVAIVYERVGCFSKDYADALPAFRPWYEAAEAYDGSWSCEVYEPLAPEPGDISLIKTGSGGFVTSALDGHLRSMGVTDVIYAGVVTNGCVLLTVSQGFDLGYRGHLAADCTATYSERLQTFTEELISGYMADLNSTDQLIARVPTATVAVG